jgi:peroxidase
MYTHYSCQADAVCPVFHDADQILLQLGGPTWNASILRKDSRAASQSAANANLPGPGSSVASLVPAFAAKGLSARDMTALSGAHTVGQARCLIFRGRVCTEPNINATFARQRQQTCSGGDGNLAPFDDQTPDAFDNAYYRNLVAQRGLLHSDQELFNGGPQDALVRKYSGNARMFAKAMIKMGGLAPAAGTPTEVRLNCRKIN